MIIIGELNEFIAKILEIIDIDSNKRFVGELERIKSFPQTKTVDFSNIDFSKMSEEFWVIFFQLLKLLTQLKDIKFSSKLIIKK